MIVNGTGLLLTRVHGQVYATDLHCPHMGADLSQGTLHGTILTCPLHNSQFDIHDGRVVRWTDLKGTILTYATNARPPRPLSCYPVRIEGDAVLVGLPLNNRQAFRKKNPTNIPAIPADHPKPRRSYDSNGSPPLRLGTIISMQHPG